MGDIIPYRSPRTRDEMTAYIGMVIFLGSWAMMFATLFFTYAGLRARASSWPPAGVPVLPLALPFANTVAIALSSAALQYGLTALKKGNAKLITPGLASCFTLGLAFLGLQTWLWKGLAASGLRPGSGAYGSVFYGLTWIHAAHVIVGLLALAWLLIQSFRGKYNPVRHLPIRLWTMYWHFVGIVWLLIFLAIFIA